MDLRHLRYFVAVAEELHFRRAAERLHVSQPPLSKQIKDLEIELNAQLLHRTQRSVELTAAGKVFYEGAKRILEEVGELTEAVGRVERGEMGNLSVGFLPSVGFSLLPRIVRRFREDYPGISLKLMEKSEVEQADEFARGGIDIGFARPERTTGMLERELLLREPLILALPTGHALASAPRPDLHDFRDQPFIDFPRARAPFVYDAVLRLCLSAGFIPRTAQVANSIYTCLGLVGAGVGVAILPASAMEMKTDQVQFRMPLQTGIEAETSMSWHRENRNPALAHFIEVCRGIAREYQARQAAAVAALG